MKSVLNLGNKCRQPCGLCCYLHMSISVEGKRFIPTPFTMAIEEKDKRYLALQVCESFDQVTKMCRDYENRPVACRKFSCQGRPHPLLLNIVGKPTLQRIIKEDKR